MAAKSKRVNTGDSDRISNLPDALLCHILSFLPTKDAASTSVLSTRWKNLLAAVPILDFDDSLFLHPQEGKRERDGILQSFMNFVERILSLHEDSRIDKFSLKCRDGVDQARVNTWICDVLERGVSELDLYISLGGTYSLPSDIFTCKTLVKLKIGTGFDLVEFPLSACFPMLKTLHLDSVGFDDEGSAFSRLLSCCSMLEELVIDDVVWEDWNGFCYVSLPTLKRLTIYYKGFSDFNAEEVSFDTPNLSYLEYSDLVADEYPNINLNSLVEARIDLQLMEYQIQEARAGNNNGLDEDELVHRVPGDATNLMIGISNVQTLYLSPDSLEVLSVCCDAIPVFDNLTHLSIESDKARGWQSLPVFLKNSPNIQTLVFEGLLHCITDGCGDVCICIPRKDVSSCLSSCPAKTLEILAFEGSLRELKLIEHFLENLLALENMMIYACVDNDEELLEITKKLLMLPRASSKCRIQVL